jgi:hypothetical protein
MVNIVLPPNPLRTNPVHVRNYHHTRMVRGINVVGKYQATSITKGTVPVRNYHHTHMVKGINVVRKYQATSITKGNVPLRNYNHTHMVKGINVVRKYQATRSQRVLCPFELQPYLYGKWYQCSKEIPSYPFATGNIRVPNYHDASIVSGIKIVKKS